MFFICYWLVVIALGNTSCW